MLKLLVDQLRRSDLWILISETWVAILDWEHCCPVDSTELLLLKSNMLLATYYSVAQQIIVTYYFIKNVNSNILYKYTRNFQLG